MNQHNGYATDESTGQKLCLVTHITHPNSVTRQ